MQEHQHCSEHENDCEVEHNKPNNLACQKNLVIWFDFYFPGDKLSDDQIDTLFADAGEHGGHVNYEGKSAAMLKRNWVEFFSAHLVRH